MTYWVRTLCDPDLGAIAEIVDTESDEVLATGASSPARCEHGRVVVDEVWDYSATFALIPPDVWARAVKSL